MPLLGEPPPIGKKVRPPAATRVISHGATESACVPWFTSPYWMVTTPVAASTENCLVTESPRRADV